MARWRQLLDVREQVNARLEEQRQAKVIGNALEAQVVLKATGRYTALLEAHADQLASLFIVSEATVTAGDGAAAGDEGTLAITVTRAEGVKCLRCWRYVPEVSEAAGADGLCARCEEALGLAGTPA
jgi:isoleucyl-tRNA synthetase